jgi:NitT/TauT family transport system permease protein
MSKMKTATTAPARIQSRLRLKPHFLSIPAVLIGLVLAWEWLAQVYDLAILVPYPKAVAIALIDGLRQGALLKNAWTTLFEALCGFCIAAIFGVVGAAMLSESPLLEKTLYPYVAALQTIPKVALAPLFVIWFGFGPISKIFICAMIAFFPILVNTLVGLKAADLQQVDLLRAHCATRWQIFKWLKFPNALPFVFAGLNIGVVLSVIGAIVGEFVGAQAGLGKLILEYQFNLEVAGVFAVLVVLGAMGMVLSFLMRLLQRRVVFWAAPDVRDHL